MASFGKGAPEYEIDARLYNISTPNSLQVGKCYESLSATRMTKNPTKWFTTKEPVYLGKFIENTLIGLGEASMPVSHFDLEIGEERKRLEWVPYDEYTYGNFRQRCRVVDCKPIEIPSLQYLAYKQVSKEDKKYIHDTLDIPEPRRGGNAVKRNKRSGRKTRRKSRKNMTRKPKKK